MRFHLAIAAAILFPALVASGGAGAFETTSIGGTNPDGSAKFQDPGNADPMASLATSSSSLSTGFGNFSVGAGTGQDRNDRTNWLSSPGSPGFGFTGSQSTSADPASPFNTPILRERN
ncbi:MAG: hypothetical protein ABWZ19_02895 [Hyphomicrobium sp.]